MAACFLGGKAKWRIAGSIHLGGRMRAAGGALKHDRTIAAPGNLRLEDHVDRAAVAGFVDRAALESGRLTSIVKHQVQLPWGGVDENIFRGSAEGAVSLSKLLYLYSMRQSKPTVDKCGSLAAQAAGVSSAVRFSGAFASPGRMSAR
jgi:hypothetical protein